MTESKTATKAAASKGFSNPALKAMGIPTIKLPSRNWMIFWSVLTVTLSGIAYDKYEQKQIVKRYCNSVEFKSKLTLDTNRVPRKITVFIAPPPNDYLETSLKVWRRYIKPILYYAGLDYEIIEEDKQGLIRTHVANQIRQIRKNYLAQHDGVPKIEVVKDEETEQTTPIYDPHPGKEFKRSFDYRDIIGIFYHRPKIEKIINTDSEPNDPKLAGGVICLGRGAYKEYINGLHEGLLGPLEQPEAVEDKYLEPAIEELKEKDTTASEIREALEESSIPVEEVSVPNEDATVQGEVKEGDIKKDDDEKKEEEKNDSRYLPRFISPEEYSDTPILDEILKQLPVIKNSATGVPILLHQPLLMIPVPSLSGFTTIPQRIVRFYQRRFYTEQVCSQVTHLINQDNIRPFKDPSDLLIGVEEEEDWPKHWVKQGLKKNSEWVQPFKSDKRVTEFISVLGQDYDRSDD
ncbi:mitochondrial import inner membrane translocase subunit tim54 [Monosporozyma unispora]|nr:mitochondrial import inner membrane translocase subunit tim54 [Kazachstania unispora]